MQNASLRNVRPEKASEGRKNKLSHQFSNATNF